jgi:hypothetical protein
MAGIPTVVHNDLPLRITPLTFAPINKDAMAEFA